MKIVLTFDMFAFLAKRAGFTSLQAAYLYEYFEGCDTDITFSHEHDMFLGYTVFKTLEDVIAEFYLNFCVERGLENPSDIIEFLSDYTTVIHIPDVNEYIIYTEFN